MVYCTSVMETRGWGFGKMTNFMGKQLIITVEAGLTKRSVFFSRDSDLTTSVVRPSVRAYVCTYVIKPFNSLVINQSLISRSSVAHQLLISHSSVAHQSLISRSSVAHQLLISHSSVAHQSLISCSSVAHLPSCSSVAHQSLRSRLLSVFRLLITHHIHIHITL